MQQTISLKPIQEKTNKQVKTDNSTFFNFSHFITIPTDENTF